MARQPTYNITVSGPIIILGRGLYQQAECPVYLFATWDADSVTLHREEDYEIKNQGVYKVVCAEAGTGTPRISAKGLVEDAGLVPGRYVPLHVDHDRITFSKTPILTPEAYTPKKRAPAAGGTE